MGLLLLGGRYFQEVIAFRNLWYVYKLIKVLSDHIFIFWGEPHLSSGGPAYKPPEDYYDEVIELKKVSYDADLEHLLFRGRNKSFIKELVHLILCID